MVQPVSTNTNISELVVYFARQWIGTPYHHQASVYGVGCDCIGLVRGVWRDVYGAESETPPAYSRDWGDTSGDEDLIAAGNRNLLPVAGGGIMPGDVFALRWRGSKSAKHVGILTEKNRFIHAYEKRGVIEVSLSSQWKKLIVGVWRFPKKKPDLVEIT